MRLRRAGGVGDAGRAAEGAGHHPRPDGEGDGPERGRGHTHAGRRQAEAGEVLDEVPHLVGGRVAESAVHEIRPPQHHREVRVVRRHAAHRQLHPPDGDVVADVIHHPPRRGRPGHPCRRQRNGAALVGRSVAVVVQAVAAHLRRGRGPRGAGLGDAARTVLHRALAGPDPAGRGAQPLVGHSVAVVVAAVARLGGGRADAAETGRPHTSREADLGACHTLTHVRAADTGDTRGAAQHVRRTRVRSRRDGVTRPTVGRRGRVGTAIAGAGIGRRTGIRHRVRPTVGLAQIRPARVHRGTRVRNRLTGAVRGKRPTRWPERAVDTPDPVRSPFAAATDQVGHPGEDGHEQKQVLLAHLLPPCRLSLLWTHRRFVVRRSSTRKLHSTAAEQLSSTAECCRLLVAVRFERHHRPLQIATE